MSLKGSTSYRFAQNTIHYCIKPTIPVRYKHVLTGENRALKGKNVY